MKITKEDFDWLYSQATGFMRTQILAVAPSLRLAEHLRNGGQTAEEFASASGIEPSMALRFLPERKEPKFSVIWEIILRDFWGAVLGDWTNVLTSAVSAFAQIPVPEALTIAGSAERTPTPARLWCKFS